MLSALQKDGQKAVAWDVNRRDGPFFCPECREDLILRKGAIHIHHFAHKPDTICSYSSGETDLHRRAKCAIYDELSRYPDVSFCDLECRLGGAIADVYAVIRGEPVAIEVQASALIIEEISRRTQVYQGKGIAVLWILPETLSFMQDYYRPAAWKRWLHAAYFGRLYFWMGGTSLRTVHLNDDRPQGMTRSWKTIQYGNYVNLAQNFYSQPRSSWEGGTIQIPRCRIYIDRQPPWWKKDAL
jgi:competence protein CoiA